VVADVTGISIIRYVIGCQFTQEARVYNVDDDVAGVIRRYPSRGGPYTEVSGLPADYVGGTGMMSQVMTLFRRHGVITVRDPTLYIGRMAG